MNARIHPTAIIDPGAEIGAGCEIGPYCVIGREVQLGPECWLQHHVSLSGPSTIGAGNRFYAFASVGQQSQDLKYAGEPTYLQVGEANTFREFCTVNRGTAPGAVTRVGSDGHFLAYSHIAHDCAVADSVIFSNNGTLAGHVEVGDHAVIGGLTAVHQFCRIGRFALTGGCSKIVQDVPPFMIADGNPAQIRGYNKTGLERHRFSDQSMKAIKEAYRILYRSDLNVQQAVGEMRGGWPGVLEVEQIIAFITSSPRGIIK